MSDKANFPTGDAAATLALTSIAETLDGELPRLLCFEQHLALAGLGRAVATLQNMQTLESSGSTVSHGLLLRVISECWVVSQLLLLGGKEKRQELWQADLWEYGRLGVDLPAMDGEPDGPAPLQPKKLATTAKFDQLASLFRKADNPGGATFAKGILDEVWRGESFLAAHVGVSGLHAHIGGAGAGESSLTVESWTREDSDMSGPRLRMASVLVLNLAEAIASAAGKDGAALATAQRRIAGEVDGL